MLKFIIKSLMRNLFFITLILSAFLLPAIVRAAEVEGLSETVVFSIGNPTYSVGEKEIKTDVAPYIKDGRTMVPIAFAAQALEAEEVKWISSEGKVVIQKGNKKVQIKIGSRELVVNNTKLTMDVAAEIKEIGNGGGRTMLPIAVIAKVFDIGYEWHEQSRTVHFYKYNKVYDRAGSFGPEHGEHVIQGNVTVKADGVTLRNLTIKGNLIIAEEVGNGTVILENLQVLGNTLVRGGGKDSLHIIGGSYSTIIIQDTGAGVLRVVSVNAEGLEIVIAEGVSGEGIILEGNFQNVIVEGNNLQIQTQGNTKVGTLALASGATGSVISLGSGTTVEKMLLESEAKITGNGVILEAEIKADNVSFENSPLLINSGDTKYQTGDNSSSGDGGSDPAPLGPPSKLQIQSSKATIKAGETVNFTVVVQDANGNKVTDHNGYPNIITISNGKGTLSPETVSILTKESQTSFTWTCNQADGYTIIASANGLVPAVYEITVEPAEVAEVYIHRDYTEALMTGEQMEFSAAAYDIYGNPITFDAADFSWSGAVLGVFVKHLAGTYAVSAQFGGVNSSVETVEVIAGREETVSVNGLPAQLMAGQIIDLIESIDLRDSYGNAVADGQYEVNIRSDKEEEDLQELFRGPVSFTAGKSGPGGNTLFLPIQLTTAGEHTITIQAGITQTTVTIQVNPQSASKFFFTQGDLSVTAGTEINITLEIHDEYGNPTTEHSGLANTISIEKGIASPEIVNINEGETQASFTFVCAEAGSFQITAAYGAISSASCGITVNPADPYGLNGEPPDEQEVGTPFNLEMNGLRDNFGNTLLTGTYHLQIESDREGSIFDGNVVFTTGARTQSIKLNMLGDHILSIRVNGITVANNIAVKMIKYPVTGISIDQEPLAIKMEETAQLTAAITPANATFPAITWSSSNPAIAKVDSAGVVTGVSKGNAIITATSTDSGLTDTIDVQVDYADIVGSGTSEKPFVIYTFAGLEKIGTGKYVSWKTTLEPVYYRLGADIDASPTHSPDYNSGKGWKPISALRFRLSGQGHKISNLKINRPDEDNIGLIGLMEISHANNLTLENADITGQNNVGGIVGKAERGYINNSSVVTSMIRGNNYVGGLAGMLYTHMGCGQGYIDKSYSTGAVTGSTYVGGLIGSASIYSVKNSYSHATVTGSFYLGGLIGDANRYIMIANCYAAGTVVPAYGVYIGGLIGFLSTDNTRLENSYYDKETTGRNDTGKGLPRTSQQMKAGTKNSTIDGETMYTNWNWMEQFWNFGTATEYPVLKNY